jgi:hypothetical protein
MARTAANEQQQWQGWSSMPSSSNLGMALYPAMTGGGGVAAKAAGVAGSASVTLYEIDPATGNVTSGETVTAWNWFPTAIGASKEIYVGWYVNAAGNGMWVVPSEYCAS